MDVRWSDLPRRIIEKKLTHADHLAGICRIAAESVNDLSLRVIHRARAGEPLEALEIANALDRIATGLALAGGVPVEVKLGEPIDLESMGGPPDKTSETQDTGGTKP